MDITLEMYLKVLAIAFFSLLANILIIAYMLIKNNKNSKFVQWLKDFMFEDDEEEEEEDDDEDDKEEN